MDIDAATPQNCTALHIAACNGHCHAVECLVGWGAALNVRDQDGDTPLLLLARGKEPIFAESPQLKKVESKLIYRYYVYSARSCIWEGDL